MGEPSDRVEALLEVSSLKGVNREDIGPLLTVGDFVEFDDGDFLFREGDEARTLFFLLEGSVRIHRAIPGGGRLDVAVLDHGTVVGEVGVLNRRSRRAAASAVGRVRAFGLDRDSLLADYGAGKKYALDLVLGIARTLAKRLDATNTLVSNNASRSAAKGTDFESFKKKILEDWAL